MDTGGAIEAKHLKQTMFEDVFIGESSIGSMCLFEWCEDVFGFMAFDSYSWKPDGFIASFSNKDVMDLFISDMMEGIESEATKTEVGNNSRWDVRFFLKDKIPRMRRDGEVHKRPDKF